MGYFISEDQKEEIMARVNSIAKSEIYYYIMIILACTIATYGLISNSTAVIIGAMLISPIMGSILGSALSIAEEDNELLKTSLKSLLLGTLIALVLSILLTLIMPVKLITPEIIARTKPTIIDLIIALASGAAATYAVCYKPDSAALPGVAISTALMPPLCVVGIGIANQNYEITVGAFLLFMANIIAINFSSIIIFKIFGFRKTYKKKHSEVSFFSLKAFGSTMTYSVVMLILISIPLTYFMLSYFDDNRIEDILRKTIKEEFISMSVDAQMVSLDFKNEKSKCTVNSVVRSNKELEQKELRQIENILEYRMGKLVRLNMSVVLVQKINEEMSLSPYRNLVNEMSEKQKKEMVSPAPAIERYFTPEEVLGAVLDEKLSMIEGLKLDDYLVEYKKQEGIYKIRLFISYNGVVEKKVIDLTTKLLEEKIKRKVLLNVVQSYGGTQKGKSDDSKILDPNLIPLPEEKILNNLE